MKKQIILTVLLLLGGIGAYAKNINQSTDRAFWVEKAWQMSYPVLDALSRDQLRREMPVEQFENAGRERYAHLEAVGRLLCGIAPWLELSDEATEEGEKRKTLLALAHRGLANGTNPQANDYLNFRSFGQPLVDAAFLAQAFLRSPKRLWGELDESTKARIIEEMKATRDTRPPFNNWLLFSATVEAFLKEFTGECDQMRTDYAFRQIDTWYIGDGEYKDGPIYHNDYYNSFVIQPMLLDAGAILNKYYPKEPPYSDEKMKIIEQRAIRYAETLERGISPEGTFPVVGRSILYRTGCMQSLAQIAQKKKLPEGVSEGQVRGALTEVMKRLLNAPGTYQGGWLTMGFCGAQKETGESYLCTGSMYLASTIFLPLGLPADDAFWTSPRQEWTSQKAWSGKPFKQDKAK